MEEKSNEKDRTITVDFFGNFAGVLEKLCLSHPEIISKSMVNNLFKPGGPQKVERILDILNESPNKDAAQIRDWEKFYFKYFGIKIDLSGVKIPNCKERGHAKRELIIAPFISVNKVIRESNKHFVVVMEVSGPPAKLKDARSNHLAYALLVANSKEPHKKLCRKSANWAEENNFEGITLLERLILELKYWDETGGQHLDEKFMTICSGSRYANKLVPVVSSNQKGEVSITQDGVSISLPVSGLREVFR